MSLDSKQVLFSKLSDDVMGLADAAPMAFLNPFNGAYDDFAAGIFRNLKNIRLRWVNEGWFEFIPDTVTPFAFQRPSGEIIELGQFFTDGGSIPRIFWIKSGLSPWEYGSAYLIHDWEFDLHHCRMSDKSFEDVRDTMMEAVKTLMEIGLSKKRPNTFRAIYDGIDSVFARRVWSQNVDCTLP